MASMRGKQQMPVGSAQWTSNEREQITQFEDEQIEDFTFAARNDFDWLNEHMAEIFSDNQLNVTEIFKTPGKLRGKTPRTARKRNPLEARAPLTDIFSTDVRYNKSPTRPTDRSENVASLKASPARVLFAAPESRKASPEKAAKQPADSGYHGLTEDEMDTQEDTASAEPEEQQDENVPPQDSAVDVDMVTERLSDEALTAETSFHSARENNTTRNVGTEREAEPKGLETKTPDAYPVNPASPRKIAIQEDADAMDVDGPPMATEASKTQDTEPNLDASPSSSDASTPEKPPLRKSSLNFASLPAREPLATKKSFGNRVSRTSQLETSKNTALNHGSYFGRFTGGKSLGASRPLGDDDDDADVDTEDAVRPGLERDESDGTGKLAQMHSKSSTQRLHERINLLGKTQQPPRPTKSISHAQVLPAPQAPSDPEPEPRKPEVETLRGQDEVSEETEQNDTQNDDDDDWITAPTNKPDLIERPQLVKSRSVDVMEQVNGLETIGGKQLGMESEDREHAMIMSPSNMKPAMLQHELKKSMSTTMLPSPSRPMVAQQSIQAKATAVPSSLRHNESTTPPGSPARPGGIEGHLSASKSKLQSIMKSARGLFTSSAGASAQARLETLSPTSLRMKMQEQRTLGGIDEVLAGTAQAGDLYPKLPTETEAPLPPSPEKGRKTRSSTEKDEKRKEKETKDRQRVEAELEKAREQERQKASKQKEQSKLAAAKASNKQVEEVASLENTSKPIRQSPRRLAKEEAEKPSHQMPPPTRPGTAASGMQQPKSKEIRRPVKPAKEPITKPRAPPVSIRVGTMSQRVNSNLSGVPDNASSSQQRPAGPTKKGSNASIQTSASTNSFKSSTSSITSKPKALIAAERKKEQDEREAQRKQEQKREIERKRAVAQEEAQKREQKAREEAEKQRERERAIAAEQEAKKVAHKQAVEKRRQEMMRRDEQQRQQAQRAAAELSQALEAEKSHAGPSRADLGPSKPPSRMDKIQDFPRPPGTLPQINPAKPPIKRVFDPDNDDELARPSRPQPGQNWQTIEGKRRKTEEEDFVEAPVRPAMAPPIRQSNIRKFPATGFSQPSKPSMSSSNYPAPSATAYGQQGQSAFKPTGQSYQQHHYGAQQAHPNRSGHPMDMAKYTSGKIPFADAPNPPAASASHYKTPLQTNKLPPPSTSKSSPHFINGEHIHLDDIPTDSDEEDSDDERDRKSTLPDWVRTPNLFQNLSDQERLNPDAVFGPIAPLNMEEVFKDKSRHKKFRDRTSSANWFADRVTEDEIKKDNAGRDRIGREGGWTYGM